MAQIKLFLKPLVSLAEAIETLPKRWFSHPDVPIVASEFSETKPESHEVIAQLLEMITSAGDDEDRLTYEFVTDSIHRSIAQQLAELRLLAIRLHDDGRCTVLMPRKFEDAFRIPKKVLYEMTMAQPELFLPEKEHVVVLDDPANPN